MDYANGDKYTGSWHDDKRHGKGNITYANGDKYDGTWHTNKRHGHGAMKYANNREWTGDWHQGKSKGSGIVSYVHDGTTQFVPGSWSNKRDTHDKDPKRKRACVIS
eukprot:12320-Heterococcus_DN1.PRE.7